MTALKSVGVNAFSEEEGRRRSENSHDDAIKTAKKKTAKVVILVESYNRCASLFERAKSAWLDALVELAEDPEDDFNYAYEKARKLEQIEREFLDADARLNFELRELAKAGISPIS